MNESEKTSSVSKKIIFDAIHNAAPSVVADVAAIQQEALELLSESVNARPVLFAEDAYSALVKRIEKGLVIGTTCETIKTLAELPDIAYRFLARHDLEKIAKVQDKECLQSLDWSQASINQNIEEDHSVGICWAEYGIAETGSFVIHSSPEMPVLLNFLPLYLIPVVAKSTILSYMDDYALLANDIAKKGLTPRNMCMISGASGTTDIEGVLVQGAHGPEFVHLVIVDDL